MLSEDSGGGGPGIGGEEDRLSVKLSLARSDQVQGCCRALHAGHTSPAPPSHFA